ncbi:hypothetical protein T265_15196, partial [Opisthorchis viverrini]
MPPEGSASAGILSGCPIQGNREAEVWTTDLPGWTEHFKKRFSWSPSTQPLEEAHGPLSAAKIQREISTLEQDKAPGADLYPAAFKESGEVLVPVDSDLTDIVKEISIMQQCDSPFIVKCYGSLFDSQDLWICMEYCGAGSIADIMRLRGKALEEREIATVLQYSLRGLDYLHQVIQEIGYNYSADIWSLGITAIEMAEGKPPLADIHPMRALFMIPSQPPPALRKPSSWSAEFRTFVTACLSKTPESRPTAAALLQTEFIRHAQSCSILLAGNFCSNMDSYQDDNEWLFWGGLPSLIARPWLHVIQEIGYNYSADIWSLGITAIEMAEGKPPLADIHPMRALFMIPSQPPPALRKPSSWSAEFRTFVTACLSKTPESRPTAAALLQTEFIRHAQSCSILLPLIEESNAAREKRLSDSKAAILSGITHEANQAHTPGEKRTSMDAATAAAAEGIDDGNGTMVRQDVSLPSAQMDHGFDGNLTLVSSDSVEVVRRTGTSGSQHSRRILSHSGNEDDPATMVIKRSDDEAGGEPQDEDEDDSGSVIVHNTNGSIDMDGRDSERHKAFEMLDAAMRPTTTVEGTLTRRAKADGVPRASVSNVQDFPNYGGAAPPVANVAARPSVPQRPFAPFSRALQHNGLFPGGLVHEPGALNRLSYAELQRLLNTLTVDLETELRNLAIRYRHKRQPLLDAIAEKTAQATEMKLMEAGHPGSASGSLHSGTTSTPPGSTIRSYPFASSSFSSPSVRIESPFAPLTIGSVTCSKRTKSCRKGDNVYSFRCWVRHNASNWDLLVKNEVRLLPTSMTIDTLGGSMGYTSEANDIRLSSMDENQSIDIDKAFVVDNLPMQAVPSIKEAARKWPHLKEVAFDELTEADIGIRIGCDVSEAHLFFDQRLGGKKQPLAVKTLLGWILLGPMKNGTKQKV